MNHIPISSDRLALERLSLDDVELLDGIKPGNYIDTYPPQRSYEDEISQRELFAFRWLSKRLGCMTYLKFAFEGSHLWNVRESIMYCPHGHKEMTVKSSEKKLSFRGAKLSAPVEQFVRSECGEEAGTVQQTAAI